MSHSFQQNEEEPLPWTEWAAEGQGASLDLLTAQSIWYGTPKASSSQVATPYSNNSYSTLPHMTHTQITYAAPSWQGYGRDDTFYASQGPAVQNWQSEYSASNNHELTDRLAQSGNMNVFDPNSRRDGSDFQQAPFEPTQTPTRSTAQSQAFPFGTGSLPGPERTPRRRRPPPGSAQSPEHPYRLPLSSLRYAPELERSDTDYWMVQGRRGISIQSDINFAPETIFDSTRTPTIDTSEPTQPTLLKEAVSLGTLASGTVILLSPVPTGQIALTAHKVQISDKIFQFVFHKRAGSSKAQATSSVLSKASDLVKGQHEGIPRLVSILGANHLFIRELTSFANELERAAGFDMLLGKGPSNDLRFGMHELNRKLGISEPIDDLVDSLHEQVLVHNAAWLIITQYGPLLGGNTRLQSYRLLNAPSVGYR